MFRKFYFVPVLFIALFALSSISTFAQGQVSGKVMVKKGDADPVPVKDAKVECYRIDIKQGCRSAKTDKRGEFIILGMPWTSTIVLSISGEGLAPRITPNYKAGKDDIEIILDAGDGQELTEEEVREILDKVPESTSGGKISEEDKAAIEAEEKKIAEIKASNEKKEEKNKLRGEYLKDGNAAFNNKNYDLAIEKFTLGYDLDPAFLGSSPTFLNNKAVSLRVRAVDNYNVAVNSKDKNAIRTTMIAAIKDFTEALNATTIAYEMTSEAKADASTTAQKLKDDAKLSKEIIKKIFNIMGQMNVNLASSLATEDDAKKAVSIYKISLGILPDDPDILAGLALALYSAGDFKGNAGNSQASLADKKESLNYWNKFKKVAPKDHKQQAVADGMIDFLKDEVK